MKTIFTLVFLLGLKAHATIGEATLTWDAPTKNEDGTTIVTPISYKIFYSRTGTTGETTIDIPTPTKASTSPNHTRRIVNAGFTYGTQWCFQAIAYTVNPATMLTVESVRTGAVCKTYPPRPSPPTSFSVN